MTFRTLEIARIHIRLCETDMGGGEVRVAFQSFQKTGNRSFTLPALFQRPTMIGSGSGLVGQQVLNAPEAGLQKVIAQPRDMRRYTKAPIGIRALRPRIGCRVKGFCPPEGVTRIDAAPPEIHQVLSDLPPEFSGAFGTLLTGDQYGQSDIFIRKLPRQILRENTRLARNKQNKAETNHA